MSVQGRRVQCPRVIRPTRYNSGTVRTRNPSGGGSGDYGKGGKTELEYWIVLMINRSILFIISSVVHNHLDDMAYASLHFLYSRIIYLSVIIILSLWRDNATNVSAVGSWPKGCVCVLTNWLVGPTTRVVTRHEATGSRSQVSFQSLESLI